MTLEAFYYSSQIVAAIAIVGSLFYLGAQTNQTSRNQRAMMHQIRVQGIRNLFEKIGDPAFAGTYRAGILADPTMEEPARDQFVYFARSQFNTFNELFLLQREGLIDDARWRISRKALEGLLIYPGYRAVYRILRDNLDEDFITFADAIMAKVKHMALPRDFGEIWTDLAAEEREALKATLPSPAT